MSNEITGNNLIAVISGGVFVLMPVAETVTLTEGILTNDEILVDNATILLADFGVTGIYRPVLLDREIKVIVRHITDDGQVPPVVMHRSPIVNIKVAIDSVTGISADEFEQGQVINVPPRKGADPRDFSLARIIKQSAGMITFEAH